MRFARTIVMTAVLVVLATPALAQPDPAALCPNDSFSQDLIRWNMAHGQEYQGIVQQCQAMQRNQQPQPAQPQEAEEKAEDAAALKLARERLAADPGLKKQCYDTYTSYLDDPSSFRLGGDYGDLLLVRQGNGQTATHYVVFSKIVRQRNQFGALVATLLNCRYTVVNGTVSFTDASSLPVR